MLIGGWIDDNKYIDGYFIELKKKCTKVGRRVGKLPVRLLSRQIDQHSKPCKLSKTAEHLKIACFTAVKGSSGCAILIMTVSQSER